MLDLSEVTDTLIAQVRNGWPTAPIWAELGVSAPPVPDVTGLAPDAIRDGSSHLSLFLYHVEAANAHESSFWTGQMARSTRPPVRYLPFALDLYYLMSAFSETNYAEEQQLMSVALRIFHGNPVVHGAGSPPDWRLKLTLEHRSYDELSRLWQATTVSLRLGVVYRASVLFITPDVPDAEVHPVTELNATFSAHLGAPADGDVVTVTPPQP